ncbi:hypothetical protein PCAR4_150174 [Paraburkholderia caribensis]|nr:hypothetical protein PCAR4_150174 [Paraburkholderia caribensis]
MCTAHGVSLSGEVPARAQKLDSAQTFGRAKKKRAWSPLKTTRYGVSARRPLEEPTTRRDRRRSRFQQRCPCEELRRFPSTVQEMVFKDTTTRPHPC